MTAGLPASTSVLILLVVAIFVTLASWLVWRGFNDGDRVDDATSRIHVGTSGRQWLFVTNRSSAPIIVGLDVRKDRRSTVLGSIPSFIIRSPYRKERGLASTRFDMLGAIEPDEERYWPIPLVASKMRLLVAIGEADRRLRIHDHPLAPVPGGPHPAGWRRAL